MCCWSLRKSTQEAVTAKAALDALPEYIHTLQPFVQLEERYDGR